MYIESVTCAVNETSMWSGIAHNESLMTHTNLNQIHCIESAKTATVKLRRVNGTGSKGTVNYRGRNIAGMTPHEIAHQGLGYVPEDRSIFPTLTVRQNLLLGQKSTRKQGRWSVDDMYKLFPRLQERADTLAGVLSGGEQQMLTMCRTLLGDPDLIMVDEPTEGLAPKITEQVGDLLSEIARRGVSVLLVEQKLTIALRISQRLYVMGHGHIVYEGTPDALAKDEAVRKEWLEV